TCDLLSVADESPLGRARVRQGAHFAQIRQKRGEKLHEPLCGTFRGFEPATRSRPVEALISSNPLHPSWPVTRSVPPERRAGTPSPTATCSRPPKPPASTCWSPPTRTFVANRT